jgi:hypothetical protein
MISPLGELKSFQKEASRIVSYEAVVRDAGPITEE